MKLRTRIIFISCVTFLVASFISSLFIIFFMWQDVKEQAVFKGYQNSYEMLNKVELDMENISENHIDQEHMNYIFKQYHDNYNICYIANDSEEAVDEVYNNTIISYEQLSELKYKRYGMAEDIPVQYYSDMDIQYAYMNEEGRNYVVFKTVLKRTVYVYRIEDITYAKENTVNMAIVMSGIILIVALLTIVILFLILKKELKPLQELNNTAMSMAEGLYNQRVTIERNDEIGQLGENFNKMAEAVEFRTDSLKKSEQRKIIFMGNLTHELKTPMTAISGYAQTMLSAKISEEEQREALIYIVDECARLERLSKKMMSLLELNQLQELEFAEIPVKKLFEAAQKSCEMILKSKDISLVCAEQGECFEMDFDLMTDVIINLIDNAVKASEPGQKIILRAYGSCIEVQDFGKGIPKELQEKILEPFYMVDKSRSRKNGGAGLGLALIAVIAQKHHINITVDSEPEKGSRFILEFL